VDLADRGLSGRSAWENQRLKAIRSASEFAGPLRPKWARSVGLRPRHSRRREEADRRQPPVTRVTNLSVTVASRSLYALSALPGFLSMASAADKTTKAAIQQHSAAWAISDRCFITVSIGQRSKHMGPRLIHSAALPPAWTFGRFCQSGNPSRINVVCKSRGILAARSGITCTNPAAALRRRCPSRPVSGTSRCRCRGNGRDKRSSV